MPRKTAITINIERLNANAKVENLTFPKLCTLILDTNGEETNQRAAGHYNADKKKRLLEYMRTFADIEEYKPPNIQNTRYGIKEVYQTPIESGKNKNTFQYEPYFNHLIINMLQSEAAAGSHTILMNYTNLTTDIGYLNEDFNKLRYNYFEFLETKNLLSIQRQFTLLFPLLSKIISGRLQTLITKENKKPFIDGVTINKQHLCYTTEGRPQKLDEDSKAIFIDNYLTPALLKTNDYTALALKIANRELSNERIIRELSKLRNEAGNTPFIYYGYEFRIHDNFDMKQKKAEYIQHCKIELNNNIIGKFLHDTGYDEFLKYCGVSGAKEFTIDFLKHPIVSENEIPTKEEIQQYLTAIEKIVLCCRIEN